MTVSKQINGRKPKAVEMYVETFNPILQTLVFEQAGNRTEIHLANSQCQVLIDILQRRLDAAKRAA